MAGIRKKGDASYCTFRFQGRRYHFALGKIPATQALAKGAEVDETLALIERGTAVEGGETEGPRFPAPGDRFTFAPAPFAPGPWRRPGTWAS